MQQVTIDKQSQNVHPGDHYNHHPYLIFLGMQCFRVQSAVSIFHIISAKIKTVLEMKCHSYGAMSKCHFLLEQLHWLV